MKDMKRWTDDEPGRWYYVGAETCHYGKSHEARKCDCCWYWVPRPMTDEEIERKFEVPRDHLAFEGAKLMANSCRPDRGIFDVPSLKCLFCMHEFTATYHDLGGDDHAPGDQLPCENCHRILFVEHIEIEDNGDPESDVAVTLTTHPPESE